MTTTHGDTVTNERGALIIIADYLSGFAGGDAPLEKWLPDAQMLINWLSDEGYEIFRSTGNAAKNGN